MLAVAAAALNGTISPAQAFPLPFASSYLSVITPQGDSQNVILLGSGYLTQAISIGSPRS